MSSGVALQVSPKLPDGTLINIQGDTIEEFAAHINWVIENAQLVVTAPKALSAAYTVENTAGSTQGQPAYSGPSEAPSVPYQSTVGTVYEQPAQAPQYQRAPEQPPPNPAAPHCAHGQMQFKTGNGAKGPWKAWMCPAPKGDPSQCSPQWLR